MNFKKLMPILLLSVVTSAAMAAPSLCPSKVVCALKSNNLVSCSGKDLSGNQWSGSTGSALKNINSQAKASAQFYSATIMTYGSSNPSVGSLFCNYGYMGNIVSMSTEAIPNAQESGPNWHKHSYGFNCAQDDVGSCPFVIPVSAVVGPVKK